MSSNRKDGTNRITKQLESIVIEKIIIIMMIQGGLKGSLSSVLLFLR